MASCLCIRICLVSDRSFDSTLIIDFYALNGCSLASHIRNAEHTSASVQKDRGIHARELNSFVRFAESCHHNSELFAKVNRWAQCTPAAPWVQPHCVKKSVCIRSRDKTESPPFLTLLAHIVSYVKSDDRGMTGTTATSSRVANGTDESRGHQVDSARPCDVCGNVTHGSQFGGNACRACAGESATYFVTHYVFPTAH